MQEAKLLEALEEEAKRERDSILQSARKEAERILEGARRRKEELLLAELKKTKGSLQKERDRVVNRVRREEKEKFLRLKWEIVEGVFEEALKVLMRIWDERKERLTLCLAKEIVELAERDGIKGTLYVDPTTVRAVREGLGKEIRVEGRDGLDGVILSTMEGKIEYRDTMRDRFKKVKRRAFHKVANTLFG